MPMPGFQMHPGMNSQQQQMMQRMQPHQPNPNAPWMSTSTPTPSELFCRFTDFPCSTVNFGTYPNSLALLYHVSE